MKEAIVHLDKDQSVKVDIVDVSIPNPGPDEVLIKVVVSGSNPKDWKVPVWMPENNDTNTGDDIAGLVHSVGDNVTEFRPGDRVAAFHKMRTPHGSFAEYAIAEAHTTFHLPKSTTFEEAATIPLAAMTAAIGLFCRLGLPEPWNTNESQRSSAAIGDGIVVYGAASAVGAYAIKLLQKSNIHPIIAIAGKGADFVEALIDRSKGDTIIDYRPGDEHVVQGIINALPSGGHLKYAYDAVTDHNSWINIGKAMDATNATTDANKITIVLFNKSYRNIQIESTSVGSAHGPDKEFAHAWFRLFALGLKDGWFTPHPHHVVPGGLGGIKTGLENLRDGKASAVKYVFRIADTEGVSSS